MRILAVSGSLRRDSYNTALLRAAAEAVPAGVEVELYARLRAVPPFDEDVDLPDGGPQEVRLLRSRVQAADALLLATPEYNGSVPGQLKNAIDWASRPFGSSALWNKPVAVVGASTGALGALRAAEELRSVLRTAGARVSAEGLALPHAQRRFDDGGRLVSSRDLDGLASVVAALASEASATLREAA